MLSINVDYDGIILKDVKRRDLDGILKWYKKIKDYQYATGLNEPMDIEELIEKYLEVVYSSKEFFVGIHLKDSSKMIGLVKGCIKKEDVNAMWIYSLIVDTNYRRGGYGTTSLKILEYYFEENYNVQKIYISVIKENIEGINFWEKNGFKFMRRMSNHITMNGKQQDIILMTKDI